MRKISDPGGVISWRGGKEKQLVPLGQKEIGALYVGNISSQFSIRDTDNNPLGEVKTSGLFVREDGSAGSMQQLNLVV